MPIEEKEARKTEKSNLKIKNKELKGFKKSK